MTTIKHDYPEYAGLLPPPPKNPPPALMRERCWSCRGTGGHDVGNGHQRCCTCGGSGWYEYEVRR
jgi:hypothetical protein